MNVAVTDAADVIVTLHGPLPLHAPVQPVKTEPSHAVGVSVTVIPLGYASLQSPPQPIPAGDELTEPLPSPDNVVVKV